MFQARDKDAPQAAAALADLCRAYWYPLYAFLRRRCRDGHEAQDLTQSFFARLLEKEFLDEVTPERGRFRAFLLASAQHFVANERDRERAIKRGGDRSQLSLELTAVDWGSGESRFLTEPSHDVTAERLFERQWALTLLDQVLNRLREQYAAAGKQDQFEILQPFLSGEQAALETADVARRLNMTVSALRVVTHRLRKRYRTLLRDEIARTVAFPDDVEDEIRHLFAACS